TDIHANLHGLDAVLRDVRQAAPDLILVGGDLTYKFAYPRETLELLATVEHQAVSGNTDIYVTEWATPDAWPDWLPGWAQPHARWTREQIGATWAAHIAALPTELTLTVAGAPGGAGDLLLTHGVPGNPFVGIHHPPGPENLHPHWAMSDAALHPHLRGVRAGLILTGHTHIPLIRRWGESTIVNPGAVAHIWRPTPDTHLARWALLTYHPGQGWEIDLRAVPYDNAAAIRGLRAIADHNPFVPKLADLIAPPPTRP
ncbi:MAG: metallophosphoesterase family protein, partial [Thermomicrobiales bacterium]